ncbi:MAG: hypothetical protein K0Q79_39 [Flavipsychrobacter sp.]|jgi:hypothetical protein|nr:hypothetical protein [Flavipsychrobacter sp.]
MVYQLITHLSVVTKKLMKMSKTNKVKTVINHPFNSK